DEFAAISCFLPIAPRLGFQNRPHRRDHDCNKWSRPRDPRFAPPMMGSNTFLLRAWMDRKRLGAFANLRALRMSGLSQGSLDKDFRAAPPRAGSGGCDRTHRGHAYIRRAFLLLSGQKANGQDRGRARLFPPSPRSVPRRARLSG